MVGDGWGLMMGGCLATWSDPSRRVAMGQP